jgi:hypothetical protein
MELEEIFKKKANSLTSIFSGGRFTVKIDNVKIFSNGDLVGNVEKGQQVICFMRIDKLWVTEYNECSYFPLVKEIKVI